MKTPTKAEIIALLRAFVAQRSGIDWRDYASRAAFMQDYRRILRDGRDARTLLREAELRDDITADALLSALRDRLTLEVRADGTPVLHYCAGQYFPTEYRAAVCAALARVLWPFRDGFDRGMQKRWFD